MQKLIKIFVFGRKICRCEPAVFSSFSSVRKGCNNDQWGLFRYSPPPAPGGLFAPPPVEAVAAATNVFTEYAFCESVDSAHNSQISRTFQKPDCLLRLVKVNISKTSFCNNFITRKLEPYCSAEHHLMGDINFVRMAGGGGKRKRRDQCCIKDTL